MIVGLLLLIKTGFESCRTVGNASVYTVFRKLWPKDCGRALGGNAALCSLSCASPATHGVIDGSIYPIPNKESFIRNICRRKIYEQSKISKIVETEYGFHIMQLIEKRGDRVKVRHILRKPRRSSENIKKMLLTLDSISTDIKAGEITFEKAVELYSADKDTRNNYGIMYNKMSASSHFALDELPVDVARVIEKLEVGDISQPFAWLLENGKTVCAIAKVKSRTDAHVATFNEDYDVLRQMYQAKLSEERIKEWVKKKQRDTYVRINKDSRGCDFIYPDWNFYEDK